MRNLILGLLFFCSLANANNMFFAGFPYASSFSNANSASFNPASTANLTFGAGSDSLDFNVNSAFSLCGWINVNSFSTTGAFISHYNGGSTIGYLTYWNADGTFHVEVDNTVSHYMSATTTSSVLTTGTWKFVCVVVDGSQTAAGMKVYVNASSQSMTVLNDNLTGSATSGGGGAICVNNNGSSNYCNALIDEISFWGYALSAGNITTLYATTHPTNLNSVSFTHPLTWYRFENTYNDSGSAGINATNHGSTFSSTVP